MTLDRRQMLAAGAGLLLGSAARAQAPHAHPSLPLAAPAAEPFARLQGGTPHHLTPEQVAQRAVASPAPAGTPGRWASRAALPIARSEMAWAAEWAGRLHVIGGYGEGRVDRAYHWPTTITLSGQRQLS